MALDLLFPNFDELIRKPEDVQRLNEAILQLAMQGKLLAQDPNDEPASELLKRIQVERRQMVEDGKIRRGKPLPVIPPNDTPYSLPSQWQWCRLGDIGDWGSGATPKRGESKYYDEGTIPWLKTGELNDGFIDRSEELVTELALEETSLRLNQPGDILIAMYGATIGKLGILEIAATTNQACCACTPVTGVFNLFLFYYLRSLREQLKSLGAGGAQPNISKEKIVESAFPLPPLNEQQRIVAKVDELFAQTRALEAKLRQAHEDVVTVNRAALHRLHTAQDDGQFQAAWRTLRDHFDVLYDDPRNVAELRQTILDLAVRGKLVSQDPNDEPAKELLERIKAEKERLVQERKIGKSKPIPSIKQSETPFELPDGWCWSRLGDVILEIQTGPFGSTLHKSDYVEGGIPVVNPANIRDGHIESLANMAVSEDTKMRLDRYVLEKGDIVMARRGEMGRCAVVTDREAGWLCGSGSFNLKTSSNMSQEFLIRLIHSPGARQYLSGGSVGSTMNNLNHRILGRMVVGVPPLPEQQRIVAKVDQLMRLCDELEAGLARAETQKRNMTVAVLKSG